ncbi:MAG: hypothetical protein WBL07_14645 [Thiothrix litoralis]|uniref:coiled-coil domain-containing protein n=1 Tax=Thiothrix litoralis TaxID=2891210 RepID=UPI003C78D2A3
MEYNPFAKKYHSLKCVLDEKNSEKLKLSNELNFFDATDIGSLYSTLEYSEDSKNKLQSLINDIVKEIEVLQTKIQETKSHIKTIFNPLNWFNDEQTAYKKKVNKLENELDAKQKSKGNRQGFLYKIKQSIEDTTKNIDRHKSFDRKFVNDKINSLNQEINLLEKDFQRVSGLKIKVDTELKAVLWQINDYESQISTIKENIRKAQSFEYRLNAAGNSYERAIIHQDCESVFGDGSPKKITRQQEGLTRKYERDLEKVKKRAIQIGEKFARDIRKIIIDGNNMCYESSKFVGLQPLTKSTNDLHKRYEIVIVFDAAIRSQLKANDQKIRAQFDKNIKVHIVATKQKADEAILDIAFNDIFCYVLSNDRYGEYSEKEVIKNNRLIRHEIVDGRVIIHDLNVNVIYG